MRHLFTIILTSYLVLSLKGQTIDSLTVLPRIKPNDFSYENKWKYVKLKKTLTVTIIEHIPAEGGCGVYAYASLTIVKKTNGDTLRILDLCNQNNYKVNQVVKIEPTVPYKCDNVKICWITPYILVVNPQTRRLEQTPTKYDLTILKTTYGKIIE